MNLSARVFRTGGAVLPVALMIMLIPCLAVASGIGTISLGGSQVVAVNGSDIDFGYCDSGGAGCTSNGGISGTNPPEATAPVTGTGDTGTFTVNTSDVPGIAPGTTATVADLSQADQPTGTTLDDTNFIVFPSANESITLTELLPGEGSPANCAGADGANGGLDCTPASNSPFNLINSPTGVDVFFDFDGTLYNDSTSPATAIGAVVGEWDQPLAGTSSQAILTALASNPSVAIASSASGSLNISSVPEPGTSAMMLLAGAGLVALSSLRRRRSRS